MSTGSSRLDLNCKIFQKDGICCIKRDKLEKVLRVEGLPIWKYTADKHAMRFEGLPIWKYTADKHAMRFRKGKYRFASTNELQMYTEIKPIQSANQMNAQEDS